MPRGAMTVIRADPPVDPLICATTRSESRVSACTRSSGPLTVTETRAGVTMKLVIAPAPVSTGIPPKERSAVRPMSPVTVTCLGERRTIPSGIVSIGTLRVNSSETLVISIGTVVTESIAARLFSGPTRRTVVGVIDKPPCRTWPDSGVTLTSDTMRTSFRVTLSSAKVISLGRTSITRTSAPLGSASSTSVGSR